MVFDLKYVISIYIILLVLLYFYNNQLFNLNVKNKKKKIVYLSFLLIIIAIISFYVKILYECFFWLKYYHSLNMEENIKLSIKKIKNNINYSSELMNLENNIHEYEKPKYYTINEFIVNLFVKYIYYILLIIIFCIVIYSYL